MSTKVISLKEYRNNITKLWKEAHAKNIKYIVLFHSKPILEVRPYPGEELIFEDHEDSDDKKEYYKLAEESLKFWHSEKDDDLFKINP